MPMLTFISVKRDREEKNKENESISGKTTIGWENIQYCGGQQELEKDILNIWMKNNLQRR